MAPSRTPRRGATALIVKAACGWGVKRYPRFAIGRARVAPATCASVCWLAD
jgi:hypothetical protein